jgi:superfamily II DNA/RNA helicase
MKSWSDLGLELESVMQAIEELGFSEPTVIQQLVIPELMKRGTQNIVFADQTGTGKTLAYLLPLIHALKQDELLNGRNELVGRPRAIVIVPNRELAAQVLKIAKKIGHTVKLRAVSLSGGNTVSQQRQVWESTIDILIATPGRLLQHYDRKRLFFSKLSHVVLDEVDMLLDSSDGGFAQDCYRVIDAVRNRIDATQEEAKFIMCGATVTQQLLKEIAKSFPQANHILSPTLHKSVANLEQHWVTVAADKLSKLKEVLFSEYPRSETSKRLAKTDANASIESKSKSSKSPSNSSKNVEKAVKRTIIFCNTISGCRYLDHTLREAGFETTSYHGEVPVDQRPINFNSFAEGTTPILVCTDVASRGLDFVSVDHVILFDFPLNSIDYLHRIGRTARGGKSGKVTNFIMKRDFVLADAIRQALVNGTSLEGLTASASENRDFKSSKAL